MRVPGHQRKSYAWRWTAPLAGLAVLAIAATAAVVMSSGVSAHTSGTVIVNNAVACEGDPTANDGGTTTNPFCTIQDAVDHLDSDHGGTGTIEVRPGNYNEDVDVDAGGSVNIHGQASADRNTIIVNPVAAYGFEIYDDLATIQHLRIDCEAVGANGIALDATADDGTFTDLHIEDCVSGIVSAPVSPGSDDNIIQNSLIEDNTLYGVALFTDADDNIVRGNRIEDSGAGVALDDGSGNEVLNNAIEDNTAAGVAAVDQSDLTIASNTINDNTDNQIFIDGAGTGAISIKNNAIGVGSDGIDLESTCACDDVKISGSSASEANCFSGSLGAQEYYLENMSGDDVDAEYNYWAGDTDPDDEICATNADPGPCDGATGPGAEVDWDPVASSCSGPTTPTPTPTLTPTAPTSTPTATGAPATATPTRTATPVSSAATATAAAGATATAAAATATAAAGAMESVTLVGGVCNPVASSYPNGTAIATIANAVSPSGILISIWKFEPSSGAWLGYSPQAPQASNLATVNRLDAIFICVSSAGTWSRPII